MKIEIHEPIGIVVTVRDRVSTLERALLALLATTSHDHPILAVLGGLSDEMRSALEGQRWADRVDFEFTAAPLNPQEGRNIGLARMSTRLCAFVDSDVLVRSGWLEALYQCQTDTEAAVVVPLILERPTRIHCAGTDLYIDEDDGVRFGFKTLRNEGMPFTNASNLRRSECDYAELHCQLVQRQLAIDLEAYDEAIPEGGEVDNGLVLREAGYSVWFEPAAVVLFDRHAPLTAVDLPHFVKKWDTAEIVDGLRHFNTKWGIDISERGGFINFLSDTNAQVGPLPRRWPSDRALAASQRLGRSLTRLLSSPRTVQRRLQKRRHGAGELQRWVDEVRATQRSTRPVPSITRPIGGAPDESPRRSSSDPAALHVERRFGHSPAPASRT